MSIINAEPYAGQAREATEKGVDAFRRGARIVAEQTETLSGLPTIDLTEPVSAYFRYVQRSVELNRKIATTWAELVTTLSEQIQEYARSFGRTLTEQADRVADLTAEQAHKAQEVAQEQARQSEQAVRQQELAARRREREQARAEHAKARERYEGLTKTDLADQLAERDLPRTGTVDELIERLVEADGR